MNTNEDATTISGCSFMKEVGSDDNIDDHSSESHEFDEYRGNSNQHCENGSEWAIVVSASTFNGILYRALQSLTVPLEFQSREWRFC